MPPESTPDRALTTMIVILMLLTLPTACQATVFSPPRLERTPVAAPQIEVSDTMFSPAPTATTDSRIAPDPGEMVGAGPSRSLTVWVNETSDAHERALTQLMNSFEVKNQVSVEWAMVAPALLAELMETAVISRTLPDIVFHPVSYTAGWADRDILDAAVADEIADEIGRDTFDPDALTKVMIDGMITAIPIDGYQQLLIYRADWAEERSLPEPGNYEAMMNMAAAFFDPANVVSGLVIPTESNLITSQYAFEQIATANGCQLIDEKGEVLIRDPACQEALDFYFSIVHQYSPVGVQTDVSARNAYLAGQTAMIIASPAILPRLAGLDERTIPSCLECSAGSPDYLAENSGILTHLVGSNPAASPANFGEITAMGITPQADREAAAAFADYWFNEGYEAWLAVEPERKVPMRLGTDSQPRRFIDDWGTQPLAGGELSLVDIYGQSVVDQLRIGVAASSRWGFAQGQATLITELHESFILPVILQEMLSGYFDSSETIQEMYRRITDLIPDYEYFSDTDTAAGPDG